jgi:hypothetical protein
MTRAERDAVNHYLRWIANRIGLQEWTFEVSFHDEFADEDDAEHQILAQCAPVYGRKVAEIRFLNELPTRKSFYVRWAVVHELLHCHFAPMHAVVKHHTGKELSRSAYTVFRESFDMELEYTLDALAGVIAESLPLIEWPKPKAKSTKKATKRG